MKALVWRASIGAIALASPALAAEIDDAFDDLKALAEPRFEAPIDYGSCNSPTFCNGYVGDEQFQLMWPENGFLFLTFNPYKPEMNVAGCATVISFFYDEGVDESVSAATQLVAQAMNIGPQQISIFGATIEAETTSSGLVTCSGRAASRS